LFIRKLAKESSNLAAWLSAYVAWLIYTTYAIPHRHMRATSGEFLQPSGTAAYPPLSEQKVLW